MYVHWKYIISESFNHLMYADDLVRLAPSSMGVINVVCVCSDYGLEHDVKYNSTKSNVMIFCCKTFKDINIPNLC